MAAPRSRWPTLCAPPRPVTAALETVDGGYGLAGMRERLLLINGFLSAGPDHGNWVVTAQVPQ